MSTLHDQIIKVLYDLCLEHKTEAGKKRYSNIYADHIGMKKKPLILTARSKVKPEAYYYYPDIWVKVKNQPNIQIFEVWHSESRSDAVEDILFSSFVEGITYLHIVCTCAHEEYLTSKNAQELVNLILNNVRDENGDLRLVPKVVYTTDIPLEIHNDMSKIKDHLVEQLAFNL